MANWRKDEHAQSKQTQERFNGMGPIIKTELKHKVNEWIQDTYLIPDFVDTNWKDSVGLQSLQFYVLIKQVVGIEEGSTNTRIVQHLTDPNKIKTLAYCPKL